MNSGVNFRRAASTPGRGRSCPTSSSLVMPASRSLAQFASRESQIGFQNGTHLAGAEVARQEDHGPREIHPAVVAQRQGGLVEDAQQQIPERVAGLFDLVEQDEAELHLVGVVLVQHFLAQQRMGLAVAQVARRRADQLGDFVAVLELGAVDLDHRAGLPDRLSAVASTMRVFPEPVGPRNRKLPMGRSGLFIPARYIW